MKPLASITLLFISFFVLSGNLLASGTLPFYSHETDYLIELYKTKGFEEKFLKDIFRDERLEKRMKLIKKNVVNKESKRNYDSFTDAYSMKLAAKFSKRWRSKLRKASQEFDVDPEVIVAILLVETGFGRNTGKYPVISVFSSILVRHHNHQELYDVMDELHDEDVHTLNRLEKKAIWAEEELEALLTIAQQGSHSPFKLKGSYAGAFGMPQFLPSSYLKWGFDSDKNGSVNLFLEPDAIYSIANYLSEHGWKRGLNLKKNKEANREAIWGYNHSTHYVNTVLKVAKKLNKKVGKRLFKRNKYGAVIASK